MTRREKMAERIKSAAGRLSFRTGVIFLALCIVCYIVSFAQMALPLSVGVKSVLWVVFFGLAKTFQYAGLAVVGVEGIKRIKRRMRVFRNPSA